MDTADCFQRAFSSAVEFSKPVMNWPGLLRRLATARALEELRSRKHSAARFAALPGSPSADDRAADPFEGATAGELADRLRHALVEIEPLQAELFCLACLEGQSYRDAGGTCRNHAEPRRGAAEPRPHRPARAIARRAWRRSRNTATRGCMACR